MADIVRPGPVHWTGDNPFIYLQNGTADWSSLSLFFRITASAHGRGNLALVVENPSHPDAFGVRIAMTDNAPLGRFLLDRFVRRFVLFRPAPVQRTLDGLEWITDAEFDTQSTDTDWSEHATSAARTVDMRWSGLGDPFAVDVPAAVSGTGAHEMFSVFRTASSAQVSVDGRRLPGATIEREFLNGFAQSAALALSETWVLG